MIRIITVAGSAAAIAAALTFALPAHAAMSDEDCMKAWSQVDKTGSKQVSLTDAQAAWADKADALKAADANKDGKLSDTEFMAICKKGDLGDLKGGTKE